MFIELKGRGRYAKEKNKVSGASKRQAEEVGNTLLFHPLSADRLENAIKLNLELLATTLKTARAEVEKSITLLARNQELFEPNELCKLQAALLQGLDTLKSLRVSADNIGETLNMHVETIRENMQLIIDASSKIGSRHAIRELLSEVLSELKDNTITPRKREVLEAQKETLINSLNRPDLID